MTTNPAPRVFNLHDTGGKVPQGAVLIDRRTWWGNPFKVKDFGLAVAMALFQDMADGFCDPRTAGARYAEADALSFEWRARLAPENPRVIIIEALKGKSVACWCRPPEGFQGRLLCHGQILVGIANGIPPESVE